jgi:hypothetical protein
MIILWPAMSRHLLLRMRADQNVGDDARLVSVVNPVVKNSALDHYVTRSEFYGLCVQFHCD